MHNAGTMEEDKTDMLFIPAVFFIPLYLFFLFFIQLSDIFGSHHRLSFLSDMWIQLHSQSWTVLTQILRVHVAQE